MKHDQLRGHDQPRARLTSRGAVISTAPADRDREAPHRPKNRPEEPVRPHNPYDDPPDVPLDSPADDPVEGPDDEEEDDAKFA